MPKDNRKRELPRQGGRSVLPMADLIKSHDKLTEARQKISALESSEFEAWRITKKAEDRLDYFEHCINIYKGILSQYGIDDPFPKGIRKHND